MLKTIKGIKYYPVSENMKFNLAQCHDKLHLMLYDAEENGNLEDVKKIEKAIEETDRLSDEASFTGYLSGKDYGRAKFWVAWRIEMRIQANIEAGNTKYLQYC